MDNDRLINFGSSVKTVGDGRVGGYLVIFGSYVDTDLTGDFFTPKTWFGKSSEPMLLYDHGMDSALKDREIGTARVTPDEVGLWIEAEIQRRDDYEKAILQLAREGKLGWSSGSAGHLVRKQKVGKAKEILAWPIVEASLTPQPAEARTAARPIKGWPAFAPARPVPIDVKHWLAQQSLRHDEWDQDTCTECLSCKGTCRKNLDRRLRALSLDRTVSGKAFVASIKQDILRTAFRFGL